MPDITLCENQTCPLRDNCKRGISYNDEKQNQSYCEFELTEQRTDYFSDEITYSCEFQIEITVKANAVQPLTYLLGYARYMPANQEFFNFDFKKTNKKRAIKLEGNKLIFSIDKSYTHPDYEIHFKRFECQYLQIKEEYIKSIENMLSLGFSGILANEELANILFQNIKEYALHSLRPR